MKKYSLQLKSYKNVKGAFGAAVAGAFIGAAVAGILFILEIKCHLLRQVKLRRKTKKFSFRRLFTHSLKK